MTRETKKLPEEAGLGRQMHHLEEEIQSLRENLRLGDELRVRLGMLSERLGMMTRISQELNTLDLDALARTAVVKIAALIGAKYGSLFLYDAVEDELVLKDHNYAHTLTRRVVVRHYRNTIMGLALKERKTICIQDIDEFEKDSTTGLVRTFADRYATRSCMCVPLVAGGYVMGILNFTDKADGTFFSEVEDLPVVEQLKEMVAVAIHNCRLFNDVKSQARVDSLTRLVTHRVFHDTLANESHRAVRYSRPLTLLMIDLDGFKKINDTYGHTAGDEVLKQTAEIIMGNIRRGDTAARYGGDEIALLLPETNVNGAVILTSRLIARLQGRSFPVGDQSLKVTASIGVAAFLPAMNATEFIQTADRALYAAKKNGRNRFEIA